MVVVGQWWLGSGGSGGGGVGFVSGLLKVVFRCLVLDPRMLRAEEYCPLECKKTDRGGGCWKGSRISWLPNKGMFTGLS